MKKRNLLHFVAIFHVASLFSTGVDNKKVGVDNEKALELTNSTVFRLFPIISISQKILIIWNFIVQLRKK